MTRITQLKTTRPEKAYQMSALCVTLQVLSCAVADVPYVAKMQLHSNVQGVSAWKSRLEKFEILDDFGPWMVIEHGEESPVYHSFTMVVE